MAKGTFTVVLTVEPAPPPSLSVVSPEDLGPVGGPLAESAIEISGGVPPYTVAVDATSGPVPPGVTINADGSLSGAPTEAGSYPVVLDVSDSAQASASAKQIKHP